MTRLIRSSIQSAEIAGHRAEQRADDRRHADDRQADEKRDARAGEHAREDVAAELVETERMRRRRPREPQRQFLRGRIERRQRRSDNRRERRDQHDDGADLQAHARPTSVTPTRIRGSRNPYARSVSRFTDT